MALVALKNVTKVYGGRRESVVALDGLSLEVADGEWMVLLGPSGCGKTTTLRLIAGLEHPSDGLIEIAGRLVNDVAPKDRDVAMVFQDFALYPHLSTFDNLAFGLRMRGTPRSDIRRRVEEAADLLGIRALLRRKPGALSGGERQRVAVGRAVVRNPRVCLFDEPLASLDAPMRTSLRRELKQIQRRIGLTGIYVTHDQQEALAMADRVAVLAGGVLQQVATPRVLYSSPANRFVAGFVGSPPMSFLEGDLIAEDGEVRFVFGESRLVLDREVASGLRGLAEGRVVLGVREDAIGIRSACDGISGGERFAADVCLTESSGLQRTVFLRTPGGFTLATRCLDRESPAVGERVAVLVDVRRAFWFEPGPFGRIVLTQGVERCEA